MIFSAIYMYTVLLTPRVYSFSWLHFLEWHEAEAKETQRAFGMNFLTKMIIGSSKVGDLNNKVQSNEWMDEWMNHGSTAADSVCSL